MIDASIITRGAEMAQRQQQQNMESLGELGGNLGQMVLGRRINQMHQLKSPEEQQAFANNSIFAPMLNKQIKADQAAQVAQAMALQKHNADIGKTQSEAYKNTTQGQGYGLDNSGKKLGAIQGAFQQASLTGDKAQVLLGMNALVRTGMMTQEDYQAQAAIVNTMNPDELKQYAGGINFANAKDPAALQYTDANTVANNAQSDVNNQRTTQASMYSTDVGAETAAAKLKQDGQQFDANLYVQQNKPLDYFTAADGTRYAVYANGQGIPVSNGQGAPIKAQSAGLKGMSAGTQKELFETTDAISSAKNGIINLKDAIKYSQNAYDGMGAIQRAKLTGHVSDSEEAKNTVMLDNIVTGNALEMLKATFGGAPTEGERAILLQLQGSANLPRSQREAIYTRAIQMAELRIKSNEGKAESIRNGSFFNSNGQQPNNQQQSTFNLFD